jgi:hypothetical protein
MNMPIDPNQNENLEKDPNQYKGTQFPPKFGDIRSGQKYPNERYLNPNTQSQEQRYQNVLSSSLEDEDDNRNKKEGSKEINWKSVFIGIAMSLVLVMVMNSFIIPLVGTKTYQADITRLETDLVAIREVDSNTLSRIDTLEKNGINSDKTINDSQDISINNILDKISKLENTIVQQNTIDINPIRTDIINLRTDINNLQINKGDSSIIAAIETRLKTIEEYIGGNGGESNVVLDGKITVEIKWDSDNIYLDTDNKTIILYNVKMYITNGTEEILDWIKLEVDPSFDVNFYGNGCNAIELEINYSNYNRVFYEASFYNSFDNIKIKNLGIESGSKEKINCEFRFVLTNAIIIESYYDIEDYIEVDMDPEAIITDYEFE